MADNLRRLLNGLGDTPQEVADFLEGQGIKGQRDDPYHCPIAVYLEKMGYESPSVCGDEIYATQGGDVFSVEPPPSQVASFIYNFDREDFPNLIQKEKKA